MNELEQEARERLDHTAFTHYNHIQARSIERDRTVFSLTVHPESCNSYGMIHGGLLYALADTAAGTAAYTDGRSHVTQNSSFHFLRNVSSGEVTATAQVRHRGQTRTLVDVEVCSEAGKVLAMGDFTFFCVDRGTALDKVKK